MVYLNMPNPLVKNGEMGCKYTLLIPLPHHYYVKGCRFSQREYQTKKKTSSFHTKIDYTFNTLKTENNNGVHGIVKVELMIKVPFSHKS